MKFSELWLREWIDFSIENTTLINQLTMAGFQVESSKSILIDPFDKRIVIGKIMDCKIHSNLNKSWVLKIKINNGDKNWINIVCSNFNCKKNLRIVTAKAGTLLPNGITVNCINIQGEKSEGVLCTFSMLKLNHYKDNIIILPEDAPIGCSFYDYLGYNDNILDINIPYNRGDCLSIVGLAREIAAINQLKLKKKRFKTIQSSIPDTIPIIVENINQCPKFLGRVIKNINVSVTTPIYIQERLRRCGLVTVNVIIDIINYVLIELGYPIHVFDSDKINQNKIYIRLSKNGESLELSNDQINLKLFENTLIISDCYRPLAIAGILIGKHARVSNKTRNIFLQSAVFNSNNIVKQSRLYNLNTVSSVRYERGIDANLSELALNYVTALLLKICSGYPGPIISIVDHNNLPQTRTIVLNRLKLDKTLGFHIKKSKITHILRNLGFSIKVQQKKWIVLIPTWRFDITIEENVISEVIRIYGYNQIPQIEIKTFLNQPNYKKNGSSLSRVKTILVDRGYQEIMTYSFVSNEIQKLLYPQHFPLTLKNPISLDMSVMRLSLWPGLIKTVIYNQNRQRNHIRLFESGICFPSQIINNRPVPQKLMIAGIRSGLNCEKYWNSTVSSVNFYDIKGDVEAILNIIMQNNNQVIFKQCKHTALHPGKSAAIYLNETLIGYIGMVHPIINKTLNLKLSTFIFELSWDLISSLKLPIKISNISKFPKNYRDISLIMPNYILASDVINLCKNLHIIQLISIQLIDVYTGDNLPKGYKSFTIKLTLQSDTHTLTEKEILKIVNQCIQALKNAFPVILR